MMRPSTYALCSSFLKWPNFCSGIARISGVWPRVKCGRFPEVPLCDTATLFCFCSSDGIHLSVLPRNRRQRVIVRHLQRDRGIGFKRVRADTRPVTLPYPLLYLPAITSGYRRTRNTRIWRPQGASNSAALSGSFLKCSLDVTMIRSFPTNVG